ncbi:MAG: UbiA family prenyltransferase, partial [Pirellulales bacterium]|nr:UbiA family prenyltransferase [Pirellulales bacterium]
LAGMVLNDLFDVAVDTEERPARPIPSGVVSIADARVVGWGLLVTGVLCSGIVSFLSGSMWPGWIGGSLALAIVLYDGRLKATPLGPLLMGLCRMFNVLLGMSLALEVPGNILSPNGRWMVAVGIGVYAAGLTRFARTEAKQSFRWQLVRGLALVMVGLALIAALPIWDPGLSRRVPHWMSGWYVYWPILALIIARRFVLAILDPSPRRVQAAVKSGIVSLIMIDAGICLGVCGPFWGCAVLLLLAPTLLLGLWIDST